MNRLLLITLLGLAALGLSQAEKLIDRAGWQFEARPRLGHLKEEPFIDLYKHYSAAFVLPHFPDRSKDDYRNYLPSGAECVDFLKRFSVDEYTLRGVEEFVILDACLGYLYESTFHEQDSEMDANVAENLVGLKEDSTLANLYNLSKINELSEDSKVCIGNLLYNSIKAAKQHSNVACNHHWIQLLNDFAECQKVIPVEAKSSDSYLGLLYSTVSERGKLCYENEINTLNGAIRSEYANSPYQIAHNNIAFWNSLATQAGQRYWNKELKNLLAAVQGTKSAINLREVANIVRGALINDKRFNQRLLNNMASWADAKIAPKKKGSDYASDPTGARRYTRAVDKLCQFFRESDSDKYYDFASPIRRLVKMLDYPEVFGITKRAFTDRVLVYGHETAPLYLSVQSCNILAFTEAVFEAKDPNHELKYKVVFKKDTSKMVRWPEIGYY